MVNTKIIADLPIELGIKRTYKGYFFLIAALELAITDQKNLLYMSKSIFPVIAARIFTLRIRIPCKWKNASILRKELKHIIICRRPESNRYGYHYPRDFKSRASASSATAACNFI